MDRERVAADSDELFRLMQEDELEDKVNTATKISVSEYATARHIAPQRVYYYIRNRRLAKTNCTECGRGVIDIAEADKLLGFAKEPEEDA